VFQGAGKIDERRQTSACLASLRHGAPPGPGAGLAMEQANQVPQHVMGAGALGNHLESVVHERRNDDQRPQFHRGLATISARKNNPTSKPGAASSHSRTAAPL